MLFNNRFDYMATPKALAQLEQTNGFVDSLRQRDDIQAVKWKHVKFVEHLGDGRFYSKFEVKVKQSKRRSSTKSCDDNETCSIDGSIDASIMSWDTTLSEAEAPKRSSTRRKYSLKCLDVNIRPKEFVFAAVDLLYEAGLLSTLHHDHIVRLHGVSAENLAESYQDKRRRGYFLLTDLMSESLRDRFTSWKLTKQQEQGGRNLRRSWQPQATITASSSSSSVKRSASFSTGSRTFTFQEQRHLLAGGSQVPSLEHRLRHVALPIAQAMRYLHKKGFVLRTLNPESGLGYEATTGKVMLCDLGLARPINDDTENVLNTTDRHPYYKAPEYYQHTTEYLKSDVYSFAMVLYELVTLQHPFEKYLNDDMEVFEKNVIVEGDRPVFNDMGVSLALKTLIRSCWTEKIQHRPSFHEIVKQLEQIVNTRNVDECPLSPGLVVPTTKARKGRRSLSSVGGTINSKLPSSSLSKSSHEKRSSKYQIINYR